MSPLTITPTPTLTSRSFCLAIISLWWQYMGCLWCQKAPKRGVEIRTGGSTTVQLLAHFPKCDNVDQFLTCPARASPPRRPTRWRTRGGPARLEGGGGEGSVWKSAKSNNFQGRKSAGKTSFFHIWKKILLLSVSVRLSMCPGRTLNVHGQWAGHSGLAVRQFIKKVNSFRPFSLYTNNLPLGLFK